MKYMDIPQLNQLSRLLSYESSECNVHARIECYSMKPITKDKRLWKTLEKEYVEDQMEVNHALFGKDASLSPNEITGNHPQTNSEKERKRSRSIEIASSRFNGGRRSSSFNSYPVHRQNYPSSISPSDSTLRNQFSPSDNENDESPLRNDAASPFRLPGQLDKSERKTLFVLKSTLNAAFPHYDFASLGADQFSREKTASAVLGSLSNTFRSVGMPSSMDARGSGLGRGASASGRGTAAGVTTYSAYPGEGSMFTPHSMPTRSEGIDVLKELERRQSGKSEYDPDVVSSTHPVLFNALDDAIGLKRGEYDVYVWTPGDLECDPHHGGGNGPDESEDDTSSEEDDEDESRSDEYGEGDTESEEGSDEHRRPFYYPGGISIRKPLPPSSYSRFSALRQGGSFPTPQELSKRSRQEAYGQQTSSSYNSSRAYGQGSLSPTRGRSRVRGSLLWSNHWFFVNRKRKRVLFISIWAKSRAHGFSPSSNRGTLKHEFDVRGSGPLGEDASTRTRTLNAGIGGERFMGWHGGHGAGARAFAARAGSSLF